MDDISTELLINLIEERPAIWDKTLDEYKNKDLTETAWKEICAILKKGFEEKDEKERQEFGKLVIKKWTHIRDSWMKSIKKHKEQKRSGSSAKPSKLYLFHEQMSFMNKIMDATVAHENTGNVKENKSGDANEEANNQEYKIVQPEESCSSTPESAGSSGIKRKRKSDSKYDLDTKMMKFIDHQISSSNNREHEDRHLSFFKSFLPSLS